MDITEQFFNMISQYANTKAAYSCKNNLQIEKE